MNIIARHLPENCFSSASTPKRLITPEGIIWHFISAKYSKPEDPYNVDACIQILERYRLSYHYFIARDGLIYELVPPPIRAWHAGVSRWNGREDCNSWMLGVSLLGMYRHPFSDDQYESAIELTGRCVTAYPTIKQGNLVGHEKVSPDRKVDPGPSWNWNRYRQSVSVFSPPNGEANE